MHSVTKHRVVEITWYQLPGYFFSFVAIKIALKLGTVSYFICRVTK